MKILQSAHALVSFHIGLSLLLILSINSGCRTTDRSEASVLIGSQGHAHNDYEHDHPLEDALFYGFSSIEADIHLVDGALLVAHDADEVNPQRTLQSLYLDPLRKRFFKNTGSILPNGSPVILLIDIKTGAEETYQALESVLQNYRPILTRYVGTSTIEGSVSVIISGNRPTKTLAGQRERLAAIDGRLPDLKTNTYNASVIPLISDNWKNHFKWNGIGACPESEQLKLASLVTQAHENGQIIRFWDNPDMPSYWELASEKGVDLINTDDLAGLSEFLKLQ